LGRMASIEESRQEFVSNVSHELKTPLTSMKVLSDSLIEQPDAPVELYREFMTDINAEVDRENKIINDLLALVKLDRKSGDMHIASVNINELLDLVIRRIKPIAQAADVEIIYESYREVLAEVDEVKLTLAITNLVENGIKYNKEGGSVTISLNADHKFFMITVSDTGIGIPKAALDRIFDRFYRVDKMRSRQTGGTGLGLAITKSVVKMHHGSIKVDSSEGEGSTFMIKIPLSYIPEV
ncbi:MAG: ATP-binding protein, partial [Lachnospiraceae bacterium]|nr:ATP-binding protein [Lachnospiraceae bacterium]